MTLGVDGAWMQPSFAPGPAGLPPGGQRGPHMHRVLRLIMTAGAVAAGLCLVVGMVTLVVALGDHGKAGQNRTGVAGRTHAGSRPPGSQRTQPPHSGAGPGSRARGANRGPRLSSRPFSPGKQLALYHGSGSAEPGPLHVPAPGAWGLYWQYRCPGGRPGEFILGETRTSASLAVTVRQAHRSGHGAYWVLADTGEHSLVIASNCAWRLRVFLPAKAS